MDGLLDWEKTSLKPYIDLLDKHVLSLMEEVRREKRKTGDPLFLYERKHCDRYLFSIDVSW